MKIETRLAQIGNGADSTTGAISAPIHQSTTFAHPSLGESTGFDYTRTLNPTRKLLEDAIADLEGEREDWLLPRAWQPSIRCSTCFSQGTI
ncbi:hypothetical protein GCM10025859_28690 [Alicyclobacillus fastidiosus]|nr:hypothetical protein GCM10025859_28690 [Alicyclobacillus fastidiosus]